MTLIITVASPHAIFQSSDFRITKSGKPLSDREPKRVAFQAHESYAQVAYTGIAELGGQMLGDWLAGEIGALEIWTMSLDEVVEVVQRRLNAALHTASLDGRLALVFAAFEKGTPRLILVSNFHDAHGRIAPTKPQLDVISIVVSGTHVHVAGVSHAVTSIERRRLNRLLDDDADPEVLLGALADINRRAAAKHDGISHACLAACLYRDGTSKESRFGDVGTATFIPHSLAHGLDMAKVVRDLLDSGAMKADEPLATVELFDGNASHPRASMSQPRAEHHGAAVGPGEVLVFGGKGLVDPLLSTELYDLNPRGLISECRASRITGLEADGESSGYALSKAIFEQEGHLWAWRLA